MIARITNSAELPRHLEGLELSPALFPDLLDQVGQSYPSHVWSVKSTHRQHPNRKVSDMRCLVVMWESPSTYVDRLPPWVVEIRHYLYYWVDCPKRASKSGQRLDLRCPATKRRFEDRPSAVAFAGRLLARFEVVEKSKQHWLGSEGGAA